MVSGQKCLRLTDTVIINLKRFDGILVRHDDMLIGGNGNVSIAAAKEVDTLRGRDQKRSRRIENTWRFQRL